MRAAVVVAHGRPPEWTEHPDPSGPDRVAVSAAPIVPLDLLCASGTSYFGPPALPYVPGVQGVGRTRDGARVWFSTSAGMAPGDGSLAELAAPARSDVVPLGSELDGVADPAVAALGLSAIAAWQSLARASLRPGERVLVLGASGTVGQVAVQAARLLGAAHVTAACRSAGGARRAGEQGADAVVRLDDGQDVAGLAGLLTDACPDGYDVVVDPLFGVPAAAAARAMAPYGRLVHLGGSAGPSATLDSATVRGRSLAVLGYTNNSLDAETRAGALRAVLRHAAAGRLSVAYETRPSADVARAWSDQAAGRADGRIVLEVQSA